MAVLCGMPTIQYSYRRAQLSVHMLFTSCIRRCLLSRDSIVDSDWLPATEWCQRYLQCCKAASDVAENLERLLVRSVQTMEMTLNWFHPEKMETWNPVKGYVGTKFLVIYNHCGVMAAWNRKTSQIIEKFLLFGRTTFCGKIFKTMFRKFS